MPSILWIYSVITYSQKNPIFSANESEVWLGLVVKAGLGWEFGLRLGVKLTTDVNLYSTLNIITMHQNVCT